jgi:hypothetical protein
MLYRPSRKRPQSHRHAPRSSKSSYICYVSCLMGCDIFGIFQYAEIENSRREAEIMAQVAAYPPLAGQPVRPLGDKRDSKTAGSAVSESVAGEHGKSWAAIAALRKQTAVPVTAQDDEDADEEEGSDEEEGEDGQHVSSRRRGLSGDETVDEEEEEDEEEEDEEDEDEEDEDDEEEDGEEDYYDDDDDDDDEDEDEDEEEELVPGVPDFDLPFDLKVCFDLSQSPS